MSLPSTRTGMTSNCRLERARTDGSRRACQDSIGDCAEVIEPGTYLSGIRHQDIIVNSSCLRRTLFDPDPPV